MSPARTAAGSVLLALSLAAAPVCAQAGTGRPTPLPTVLKEQTAALDRAGAVGVVAAASDGRRQAVAAAGVRAVGGVQARPTDRARIGSITKPMVATVALQLVDEGRLRLDTKAGDVVPDLLPGHGDITLEQLLSHRSGLPDYLVPLTEQELAMKLTPEQSSARTHTTRSLVSLALTERVAKPGTAFAYSNTNYLVVGEMLQRRTGTSLRALLTERVFRRSGLTGTFYAERQWMPATSLTEYYVTGLKPTPFRQNATVFGAAGAVVSTPQDVDRFLRALVQGRLTSRASLAQMLRPRTTTPARYGLGILAMPDPCAPVAARKRPNPPLIYGHDGATFGTMSDAFVSPDGRRVATAIVTGRFYPPLDIKKQPSPRVVTAAAFSSMCS